MNNLKIGEIISNKKLSSVFKCSTQGGMRRSHKTNSLVIVSDHTRGIYEDRWEGNVLHYTGMGLEGDQKLTFAQNKTLSESRTNNVEIHLFEVFNEGKYAYQGRVELKNDPYSEKQPDRNGVLRKVWIFPLKLTEFKEPTPIPENIYTGYLKKRERIVKKLSDKELDEKISRHSGKASKRRTEGYKYCGSSEIKEKAKRLANGKCALCKDEAPFSNKIGKPYLEGHHIVRLADGGADTVSNVVALCPNCHRKMHVLNRKEDVKILLKIWEQYCKNQEMALIAVRRLS